MKLCNTQTIVPFFPAYLHIKISIILLSLRVSKIFIDIQKDPTNRKASLQKQNNLITSWLIRCISLIFHTFPVYLVITVAKLLYKNLIRCLFLNKIQSSKYLYSMVSKTINIRWILTHTENYCIVNYSLKIV